MAASPLVRPIVAALRAVLSPVFGVTLTPEGASGTEIFTLTFYDDGFKDVFVAGTDVGAVWTWSGGATETGDHFTGGGGETFAGTTLTLTAENPANITTLALVNNTLSGAWSDIDFTVLTGLQAFYGGVCIFTGVMPTLPETIQVFDCNNDSIGDLIGSAGTIPTIPASCHSFSLVRFAVTTLGDLSDCTAMLSLNASSCANLADYVGGTVAGEADASFTFEGGAFTAAALESFFAGCVANGGFTAASFDVSGGTNAAPNATTLGYIATLEGAGCTVTHN